ncbi:MAG: RES domain-containing protein [Bacteroidetes bacterium]|jgi:hypothetical protein|nr:RES domain-containing protein [Bacteroidota bacterium]MBT7995393.1 RES domain-containing protein [Bacteroidota bacterium]
MSFTKRMYEEYMDRGYSAPPDRNVCNSHFKDYAIKSFIKDNSIHGSCDYCNTKSCVLSLNSLLEFLNSGISFFYGSPENEGVAWDSSEGGWQLASVIDAYDLFSGDIGLEVDNQNLYDDIINCFTDNQWCLKDPYGMTEFEELSYSWEHFCNITKHKIRYSFFKSKNFDLDKYNKLTDILYDITAGIDQFGLIKSLNMGKVILRGRQHKVKENIDSFDQLTSPPNKLATANRMSPAGISMFYGAFDKKTTIKEVKDKKSIKAKPVITIGLFELIKNLNVVDFTHLPQMPSIFDEGRRTDYFRLSFLYSFVRDLSKRIERDDRVHIEYVPTQIITEFLRFIYPIIVKQGIDGVVYKSSKKNTGNCIVLFLDHDDSKNYLDLTSTKTINI